MIGLKGGGVGYVNVWISRMSRGGFGLDFAHFVVKIGKTQRYVSFLQLSDEVAAQSAFYPYCPGFDFMANLTNLYSKINSENPFAAFFTGYLNGHSEVWWPDGDSSPEGRENENLLTFSALSQIISEPTNFEPHKNPSCIDLVITDHPKPCT